MQVYCNESPCAPPGQVCCFNPDGPGDHCGPPGTCGEGWLELTCHLPSDCPGGVCCATYDFDDNVYLDVSCQPSCQASGNLLVCDLSQPWLCPAGQSCHPSQSLGDGYAVCY